MASGTKTLIQGLAFLEALHHQLLNLDPRKQEIERFGPLVPKFASEEGTPASDVRELERRVWIKRSAQDVRIIDAIRVVREVLGEHGMAEMIPASELDHATDCGACGSRGMIPGPGRPCVRCGAVNTDRGGN